MVGKKIRYFKWKIMLNTITIEIKKHKKFNKEENKQEITKKERNKQNFMTI